jgi:hypothetical protein
MTGDATCRAPRAPAHTNAARSWNTARSAGMGMSFFSRSELPYYYQLYDSFLSECLAEPPRCHATLW